MRKTDDWRFYILWWGPHSTVCADTSSCQPRYCPCCVYLVTLPMSFSFFLLSMMLESQVRHGWWTVIENVTFHDWRVMYFGVLMFVILLILANFAIALVTYICGDIIEEIAVRTFVFLFCAMMLVLLAQPILWVLIVDDCQSLCGLGRYDDDCAQDCR